MEPQHKQPEYIYNSFIRLSIRSVVLDAQWIKTPGIPKKYLFLLKKYVFLIASPLFWHRATTSYRIRLWKQYIHLENREHIGIIQSTFINNAYLKNNVKPNGIVIDIGAHTGEFALFCDVYLQAKQIYSFEPVERSYRLLSMNKKDNNYHTAIGTTATITMHIPEQTSMASSIPVYGKTVEETDPCIQLDDIQEIADLPRIDLLKIDVEGMEYDCLMASSKTLRKASYLLIEASIDRPSTKPALETICSLAPTFQLAHIGQIFGNFTYTDSVDLLFKNSEPTT